MGIARTTTGLKAWDDRRDLYEDPPAIPTVELAGWIAGLADWSWFATVTLRPPRGATSYDRRGWAYARRAWLSLVATLQATVHAPGGMKHVSVIERHDSGVPHVHGLIAGPRLAVPDGDIPRLLLEAQETMGQAYGWTRVKPYDPARGGALYVVKYVLKSDTDLAIVGITGRTGKEHRQQWLSS